MNRLSIPAHLLSLLLLLAVLAVSTPELSAQEEAPADEDGVLPAVAAPVTPAVGGAQILEVDETNIASLRNLSTQGRANAVSLGVSLEALQSDNAAWLALAGWVRDGGIVFLHTDAAQLFGFQTVPVRLPSAQAAGQLFGRAKAALPFGAHPLLWSGAPSATELPSLDENTQLLPQMGVQTVFYQAAPGDHLVVDHPAGTPLLRVTDLAGVGAQTLYAAAIAPFGNGWAVFTPRLVEQPRADGATFVRNLTRLASSGGSKLFATPAPVAARPAVAPPEPFVGLPATIIETATTIADAEGDYAALAAEWTKATARVPVSAFTQPEQIAQAETIVRLPVTASEAAVVTAALGEAARGGDDTRFRALIFVLRARLELQRGDLVSALTWLESANAVVPDAAEVLLWQGVWSVASSQNVQLDSPARGRLLAAAVQDWTQALSAPSLVRGVSTPAAVADDDDDDVPVMTTTAISGVAPTALQTWIAAATRAGELALVEPPLVTPMGGDGRVVLLRHFPEDPTLRTALPTGALLARADNLLGWGVEVEEILIFPNDQYYAAYSQAARLGSRQVAFSPLSNRGNAIDNRILMVSQITVPVLLDPGPPPRYGQLGAAVPSIIARLHAQVLLNAVAQDGAPIPEWMQLGLMSISNIAVASTLGNNQPMPEALAQTALVGGLLSPDQFRGVNIGADQAGLVEAQARRLMLFFYEAFGPGAVVETLQRIGSGQDTDEALQATTELTEEEFFQAWYNAEFGNRPRPN